MSGTEHRVTIRTTLPSAAGTFAAVVEAIAAAGGAVDGADLISSGPDGVTRDFTVSVVDQDGAAAVAGALEALDGVTVGSVKDRVVMLHEGGKIGMRNSVPIATRDDLAMAYTPGVARVCMAIHDAPEKAWDYTIKANSVMVVSDGSSVVGNGDLGAEAALPAVEAKALFLRRLAGIDAFPLPIDERDITTLADIIERLSSVFAGIHLTDISAPRCFELLREVRARKLGIPILHDDQEGTAAATLAALSNGLRCAGKTVEDSTIVVSGLGAGEMSTVRILVAAGAGNVIAADSEGAVHTGRGGLDEDAAWAAENTNPEGRTGEVRELLVDADAFVGMSAPGIITADDIRAMAADPVVLAMAMPEPEISIADAADACRVYGSGRPEDPNQITSSLAYPGIWKGILRCRAQRVDQQMVLAASRAIAASCGTAMCEDYVVPSVLSAELVDRVADAVRATAESTGSARATAG